MIKKSYRALSIGIIGLIIIAVTLSIFFLLSFEKIAISWWALSFVLLAEIALLVGLEILVIDKHLNKVFVSSGVSSVLFLYFVATIISCFFASNFKDNINSFIIIEIVIIAITAIITILIFAFSHGINATDQKTVSDRKLMQICEKRIYCLLADTKNKDFEKQLNSLYENIKFGDKIGFSSVDEKIVSQISKLEQSLQSAEKTDNEINSIFDEISTFITQRKMEVAESKRGGF